MPSMLQRQPECWESARVLLRHLGRCQQLILRPTEAISWRLQSSTPYEVSLTHLSQYFDSTMHCYIFEVDNKHDYMRDVDRAGTQERGDMLPL